MGNIFARIEIDLKEGRKKKACDRLRNLINHFPDDISLREKLGEIYYDSGFLDEAGKFWILSEPKNDEMKKAIDLYRKSLSNSGNAILNDIVFRGDKNQVSAYANKILNELEADSFKRTKNIPRFESKNREKANYQETKEGFLSKFGCFFVGTLLILIAFLGFIKFFEVLSLIFQKI